MSEAEIADFEGEPLAEGERLIVDLDGYEGPLDLLLDLARREKLDLHTISILDLVDQYLAYIRAAQVLRLEVAGDYLVMAAWLTYLKSRLLIPKRGNDPAPPAEDMAEDLARRLRALEDIRARGAKLAALYEATGQTRPRGASERVVIARKLAWEVSLVDLLRVYAERRVEQSRAHMRVGLRRAISIPEARAVLERIVGPYAEWCPMEVLIAAIAPLSGERRSACASSFVAALELEREGKIEIRQEENFAPLYLRGTMRFEAS